LENIDEIIYSYDIGYTKDDKNSYKFIEDKMGYLPNEFMHIGDTLKSDYFMLKNYGWNALYFGKTDDESISSIEKLDDILKKV